jgi:hypothetical protein
VILVIQKKAKIQLSIIVLGIEIYKYPVSVKIMITEITV